MYRNIPAYMHHMVAFYKRNMLYGENVNEKLIAFTLKYQLFTCIHEVYIN